MRYAAALAALLGEELRLTDIRARRDRPGLRPQHLKAIEAVKDICQGTLNGGNIGSSEITFRPGKCKGIIEVKVIPTVEMFQPLRLPAQGKLVKIEGVALCSHLRQRKVSQRMAQKCSETLRASGYDSQIESIYDDAALQAGAALAQGQSEYRIPRMTEHVETNLWLVESILGARVEVQEDLTVRIDGIGYNGRS